MYTYKITGWIDGKRVDDRMFRANEIQPYELAKEYVVRWAMVKGKVIDKYNLKVERI